MDDTYWLDLGVSVTKTVEPTEKSTYVGRYPKVVRAGAICSYPTADHGFRHVMRIPEYIARLWLDAIGYQLNGGMLSSQQDKEKIPDYGGYHNNQWVNKIAIIIGFSNQLTDILAVYNHDGRFYLISKPYTSDDVKKVLHVMDSTNEEISVGSGDDTAAA
ncbi:MAG: hypothetical protein KAS32_20935 [Candidatus Peribacteraceae bacterium]|nr:hypothetical protein [Candidatus Peribacteraceae bacterium]